MFENLVFYDFIGWESCVDLDTINLKFALIVNLMTSFLWVGL